MNMHENISDSELIGLLEQRPGVLARYVQAREASLQKELALVNEKLIMSEDIKTHFLSNIRNEIINPVSALLELSQALVQHSDAAAARLAGLIFDESHKLNFQMRNILASAELEAGEATLNVSLVNPLSLVQAAVTSFSKTMDRKSIEVEISGIAADAQFFTDAEKLDLIIHNLISNAIQFSFKGGKIEIRLAIIKDTLNISVRDFGIGISQKDQDEVFSRFIQLHRGTTKPYPGHGLGLSLTSALLEVLQGSMAMESKPEKGSTFCVSMPQAQVAADDFSMSSMGNEFLFDSSDEIF